MRSYRDIQPEDDALQPESARMKGFAKYLRKMQLREKAKISVLDILNLC